VLFNSLTFLLFFACVFSLYQLLPTWTAQKRLLLVASYLFYAAWFPPYVGILALSTTVDWWIARRIWQCEHAGRRKRLLLVSLLCNLGLLGFFKYGGFLLVNFRTALAAVGIEAGVSEWDVALPIGISFYTFASLSYTIDVYRREIRGDWRLSDYALFVSFFPHLVAGPIVRARMLLPQIEHPRRASADQISWGLALTCIGLFAKAVLADSIFAPIVDQVYKNPTAFSAVDTWAAVLGFSGQIYFDFAGYSLCAIGLALCFGFEFPDNFRYPYAAVSFSDFWHRWHITLSSWLRDYLYIPLGGSRNGVGNTYRNLMLTMLIGGLWHGASWMFAIWGGLHGAYLAAERWLRERFGNASASPDRSSFVRAVAVFLIVTLTWIPFRAPDLNTSKEILAGLFRAGAADHLQAGSSPLCLLVIGATVAWQYLQRSASLEQRFAKLGDAARVAVLSACLIGIFLCSGGDERAFIYFQF
jgi:D-alanyl-lipoteichoic acid acyltransferase DltB (MBOAT superfamily)